MLYLFSFRISSNSIAQAMMTTTSRQVKNSLPAITTALAAATTGSYQGVAGNYMYTPKVSMSTGSNANDSLSAFKNSDIYKKMVLDHVVKNTDIIKNSFVDATSTNKNDWFADEYLKSLNKKINSDDQDNYNDIIEDLAINNAKELSKIAKNQGYKIPYYDLISYKQFKGLNIEADKLKPLRDSIRDSDIQAVENSLEYGPKENIISDLIYALKKSSDGSYPKKDMQIIELISKSIDINQVSELYKYSPFIAACLLDQSKSYLDKEEIIKSFIRQGADVNQSYLVKSVGPYEDITAALTDGNTPLLAILTIARGSNTDLNCIELLLEAGADVNKTNNFGQTPLMVAINRNEMTSQDSTYPAIIELLKTYGAQEPSTWAKFAMSAKMKALYAGYIKK